MPRPFPPSPIARISVRPDHDEPNGVLAPRRAGMHGQPHSDATFAAVRRLVEESTLSYGQIKARTGVSHASICRWTRDQGWKRPPFAPRANDLVPARTASLAYDAVALIAALTKTQGKQRFSEEILTNSSGFTGIDGLFRFRPDGTNQRGLSVMRVTPTGGQVISPPPKAFGGSAT